MCGKQKGNPHRPGNVTITTRYVHTIYESEQLGSVAEKEVITISQHVTLETSQSFAYSFGLGD
jgi:hypothetical protein